MPILQQKPVTPSGRFFLKNKVDLDTKSPESLFNKRCSQKKRSQCIWSHYFKTRGGGHKRLYRQIDFSRDQN
jgi:ribosomal protein L2